MREYLIFSNFIKVKLKSSDSAIQRNLQLCERKTKETNGRKKATKETYQSIVGFRK